MGPEDSVDGLYWELRQYRHVEKEWRWRRLSIQRMKWGETRIVWVPKEGVYSPQLIIRGSGKWKRDLWLEGNRKGIGLSEMLKLKGLKAW